MKPPSRSRSGQARDRDGRFIKGGSEVVASDPALVKRKEAAAVRVAAVQVAAVVQDAMPVLGVAEQASDDDEVGSAEQTSEDGEQAEQASEDDDDEVGSADANQVSDNELDGCSSAASDFRIEEGGVSVEQQDLCSTQVEVVGEQMAQKVFDELPEPDLGAVGGNLGGDLADRVLEKGLGSEKQAPWVNLFKDNRNLGNGIKLQKAEVEGDLVQLEEEDVDEVEVVLGICLVGLFAGKFPGVGAVRRLREDWKVACTHWIHRSGWIVFVFQSEDDRLKVLNGGPYFAYGRNLMLKIMPRCFRFGSEEMTTVPAWIQLPDLPLDCWNARALSKIASKVGIPISSDKMTRTIDRLSFARVLVEVDVSKDLVTSVAVKLPTGVVYDQLVVFESTPIFCKKCRTFGHGEARCNNDSGGRTFPQFVPKRKTYTEVVQAASRPAHSVPGQAANRPVQAAVGVRPTSVRPASSVHLAKDVQPSVQHQEAPVMGTATSTSRIGDASGGLGMQVGQPGPTEAAPSAAAVSVAARVGTGCPVDGGWTSVGNKGKKKKKNGQTGAVAVQQLPVGEGIQVEQEGVQLELVVEGSSVLAQQEIPGQPNTSAVRQQVSGSSREKDSGQPGAVLKRSDEVAAGKEPDTRSWAERNDMVSVGSGYVSREILMRKGRRYFRGWR